jgi:hypothetical protein
VQPAGIDLGQMCQHFRRDLPILLQQHPKMCQQLLIGAGIKAIF